MTASETESQATFVFKVGKKVTHRVTAGAIKAGTRSTCDLVLSGKVDRRRPQTFPDPIAAEEHCEISWDRDAFWIRDLGTATGTFLHGVAVEERVALAGPSEIVVGGTRIKASPAEESGQPVLELQVSTHSFHLVLRNTGKGEFDSDTDRMARDELDLARPALVKPAGWCAVLACLLLVPLIFTTRLERTLFEPGPLSDAHASLFDGASGGAAGLCSAALPTDVDEIRSRACDACHVSGQGTPVSRCASCHGAWTRERHPWKDAADTEFVSAKISRPWGSDACALCHREHGGADAALTPDVNAGTCDECHSGLDIARAPGPELQVRRDRRMPVGAFEFSHADHLVARGNPGQILPCVVCHQDDESSRRRILDGQESLLGKDRSAVQFEICAGCHVEGRQDPAYSEWWPDQERVWKVTWHGGDDRDSRCAVCHTEVFAPELRMVARSDVDPASYVSFKGRYTLRLRTHREHLEEFRDQCRTCHRSESIHPRGPTEGQFWHALHVASFLPPVGAQAKKEASAECETCHAGRAASTGLTPAARGRFSLVPGSCAERCHREGGPQGAAIEIEAAPAEPLPGPVQRPDFPHQYHVGKDTLPDGCFSCHEFQVPAGASDVAAVPVIQADKRTCDNAGCHRSHENVGGGFCSTCHRMAPGKYSVYFGESPPAGRPRPERHDWPAVNCFSHFTSDHEATSCTDCHEFGTGDREKDIRLAKNLAQVPIPDESYPRCRECHRRKRFHWR